LLNSFDR